MANVNHYPWDNGAIDQAFIQVLGIPTLNKTIKTKCGKRVAKHATNVNQAVTCEECRSALRDEATGHIAMADSWDSARVGNELLEKSLPVASIASLRDWAAQIEQILARSA